MRVAAAAAAAAALAGTATASYMSGNDSVPEYKTYYETRVHTITRCPPTVTDCPAHSVFVTTETVAVSSTVCPGNNHPIVTPPYNNGTACNGGPCPPAPTDVTPMCDGQPCPPGQGMCDGQPCPPGMCDGKPCPSGQGLCDGKPCPPGMCDGKPCPPGQGMCDGQPCPPGMCDGKPCPPGQGLCDGKPCPPGMCDGKPCPPSPVPTQPSCPGFTVVPIAKLVTTVLTKYDYQTNYVPCPTQPSSGLPGPTNTTTPYVPVPTAGAASLGGSAMLAAVAGAVALILA